MVKDPATLPAPVYKEEKLPPQPFAYEYGVADDYSKANFKKTETQDAEGKVAGSFTIALPDGRIQTTTWVLLLPMAPPPMVPPQPTTQPQHTSPSRSSPLSHTPTNTVLLMTTQRLTSRRLRPRMLKARLPDLSPSLSPTAVSRPPPTPLTTTTDLSLRSPMREPQSTPQSPQVDTDTPPLPTSLPG